MEKLEISKDTYERLGRKPNYRLVGRRALGEPVYSDGSFSIYQDELLGKYFQTESTIDEVIEYNEQKQ